jgi:hypothetical protein
MSTIPNSNNIDAQDQNLLTHEFHSLFQKMNNEQHIIYLDVICKEKKFPNEPLHLFITRGANTCKTFTLMLLIQGELRFYNKHSQYNLSKKKTLFMAYMEKQHSTLDLGLATNS